MLTDGVVGNQFASIRAVLQYEHPAPRWCNLAQEAGYNGIVQFDRLRLRFAVSTTVLVSLIFTMMTPRKAPIPRTIWEPNG